MLIANKDTKAMEKLKKSLEFDMKDLGAVNKILGDKKKKGQR